MKIWWVASFGVVGGLLGGGLLFLLASLPQGESIQLISPPSPAPFLVQVSGAVPVPGVYPMPPGSRVQDALQAAGGLLPNADPAALNLAELVQDGQKIWAPWQSSGERINPELEGASAEAKPDDPIKPGSAQRININTANQVELERLPGIGPVLAQRILTYRAEHGLFTSIQQLDEVPGIGPATFSQIKNLVIVAGEQ